MAACPPRCGWWSADLADWFTAVFLIAVVVAAGRIALRRTALAAGGGGLPTVGAQLAMSAGMLVMLL
jgi:hypothetical protein